MLLDRSIVNIDKFTWAKIIVWHLTISERMFPFFAFQTNLLHNQLLQMFLAINWKKLRENVIHFLSQMKYFNQRFHQTSILYCRQEMGFTTSWTVNLPMLLADLKSLLAFLWLFPDLRPEKQVLHKQNWKFGSAASNTNPDLSKWQIVELYGNTCFVSTG